MNGNRPRMAPHGQWIGEEFKPDCPFTRISKEEQEAKELADKKAERRQRVRIGIRAQKGKDWDGVADNDNVAWPLATSLVREGNTELLKAALAYRKTYNAAKSEAVLGGSSVAMKEGFALDRHIHVRENGTIAYKHVRQRTAAEVDIPSKQYVAPPAYEKVTDETIKVSNWSNIPKPWNGDMPVNNMIDAQSRLSMLQARLGILIEPLEMAVMDGATYQTIGNKLGVANRAGAMGAGCAAVHMALIVIRDALGHISKADLAAAA